MPPIAVSEDQLLDTLATVSHSTSRFLGPGLTRLRASASTDTTLVVVTAPCPPSELTSLTRAGLVFGPKIGVLVHPVDPDTLPPERRSQLDGRASVAHVSLSRSGWDVVVLPPSGNLRDVWHVGRNRPLALSGSSR